MKFKEFEIIYNRMVEASINADKYFYEIEDNEDEYARRWYDRYEFEYRALRELLLEFMKTNKRFSVYNGQVFTDKDSFFPVTAHQLYVFLKH